MVDNSQTLISKLTNNYSNPKSYMKKEDLKICLNIAVVKVPPIGNKNSARFHRQQSRPQRIKTGVGVSDHSCQNAIGRQREIWADQLKYQSLVFKSSVVSHGFNGNTVGSLFDGRESLPVSMLLFLQQQFTFGLAEFCQWDKFNFHLAS